MAFRDRTFSELLPLYAECERVSFVLHGDGVCYDTASPQCRTRRKSGVIELLFQGSLRGAGESLLLLVGVTSGAVERLGDLSREVLRYRSGLLLPIKIEEFRSRVKGRVVTVQCGVLNLPQGRVLSRSSVSQGDLSEAVRNLELGMLQRGVSFGELTEDAMIYGVDGKLYPFVYESFRCGVSREDIHAECEAFRARMGVSLASIDLEDEFCDPYVKSLIDSDRGFLRCREPHEDRIAVEGVDGWGFIDSEGRIIVEPRYHWVSDFREGRAEVCIIEDALFGVIDRNGVGLSVGTTYDELLDCDESVIIRNKLLR